MKIMATLLFLKGISKSLLIGSFLILMQSMPVCAKAISISTQGHVSGASPSNASLLGGAYFMVLMGVGYLIKCFFDLRKSKRESAQ